MHRGKFKLVVEIPLTARFVSLFLWEICALNLKQNFFVLWTMVQISSANVV